MKGAKVMDLLNLFTGAMTSQSTVNTLSEKTGASNTQIKKLLILALPLIIKAMTSNASSQNGASSLLSALTQHKSTASLDTQVKEADAEDGAKIIGHILGGNSQSVMNSLAAQSGMNSDQVGSVLANIAPALLSGVSAAKDTAVSQQQSGIDLSDGLDMKDLIGIFGAASAKPQASASDSASSGMSLLSALTGFKF